MKNVQKGMILKSNQRTANRPLIVMAIAEQYSSEDDQFKAIVLKDSASFPQNEPGDVVTNFNKSAFNLVKSFSVTDW
jgi:hypothetical protein